ncbi:unnamed protein product, partial [marine sediment metagenome]
MSYKEAVERKITKEANELGQCRELWRKLLMPMNTLEKMQLSP